MGPCQSLSQADYGTTSPGRLLRRLLGVASLRRRFHFFFSLFIRLRPASRFDRHFQTHRTRLGRPFIAYQLSTRGPHIVTSYVWAGVATTDQIRWGGSRGAVWSGT